MKMSVERLRWGLAGAVVLLLAGLAALVSYGRYAAARRWKDLLARNGIHVTRESDNVTWSQSVQGRTVFTVRAKKAIPIANGKYTLRGVTLLLYGKTTDRVDRIEGDEFEYDEKAGVARAIGEVHMDIEAPGALRGHASAALGGTPGAGKPPEADEGKGIIHVLTSGLVYVRKLGVAATPEHVEFRYAGLTCVSKGAEFDTNGNALHLLADVEMTGDLHGRPTVVRAARADLDRAANTIAVKEPSASAQTKSGEETGRAANALLTLRADGTVQHAEAGGGVVLESAGRRVAAERLEAVFGEQNVPQTAVLRGGVTLDGSAAKPMHGAARTATLRFTPGGAVKEVAATGDVRLGRSLWRPGEPPLAREMRGEQVVANFEVAGKAKKTALQSVHATGGASVRSEAFAMVKAGAKLAPGAQGSGVVVTQIAADDLLAAFTASGKEAELQRLTGQGHTSLHQTGLNAADQTSTADALQAAFAPDTRPGVSPGALRLLSAVQTGHVQIRDQAATVRAPGGDKRGLLSLARGERAAFDAASDRLTLTGATYQQEGTSLSAGALTVEQGSGNAEAQGNVEATLAGADREATHVLADRARLVRAAETAEFFGTDGHPARLWQRGSQVMAADLFLDDRQQSLAARPASSGGSVEAVFSSTPGRVGKRGSPGEQAKQGSAGEAVHVTGTELHYSGQRHEAVITGGVRMRRSDMQARAQQAVVFLESPAPGASGKAGAVPAAPPGPAAAMRSPGDLGGTLERLVLSGNVRLQAPAGAGDGEQLVYTAKEESYVLTGTAAKPPRVASTDQGMVTGPALLFRSGEKSVIVGGASASNAHDAGGREIGGRVHTDVAVQPRDR